MKKVAQIKNIEQLALAAMFACLTMTSGYGMQEPDDLNDGLEHEIIPVPVSGAVTPALLYDGKEDFSFFDSNSLLGLPNELILKILAHNVEDNYFNGKDQNLLIENFDRALKYLANMRLTNKIFANLLGYKDILYILREAGISFYADKINPETGEALLHKTLRMGYISLSRILIMSGVNVNIPLSTPLNPKYSQRFRIGSTPLHIAATNGYLKIVQLLVKYGADISATVSVLNPILSERTALDLARENSHAMIVESLENVYASRGRTTPAPRVDEIEALTLDVDHHQDGPIDDFVLFDDFVL